MFGTVICLYEATLDNGSNSFPTALPWIVILGCRAFAGNARREPNGPTTRRTAAYFDRVIISDQTPQGYNLSAIL